MPSTDRVTPPAGSPAGHRGRHPDEQWLSAQPPWVRRRVEERLERRHDRPSGPGPALRLWVPVVLSFIAQVMPALAAVLSHRVSRAEGVAIIVLALVGPIALIVARRFPGPVVAIVAAAAAADLLFTPGSGGPYLALAFAIVSALVRGARIWAVVSVTAGWVVVLIGSIALGVDWHPFRVIATTVGILVVMVIGEVIRTRGQRLAQFQAAARKRRDDAAQAERTRIARELHDVLAHSLSQINVQAGVGLHLIEAHPEQAAEALANIKQTSKVALDEVRGVLGFLRSESDAPLLPEADLSRLPALAASMSSSALQVTIDDRLTTEPPAGLQLALYRIAQESLTNVVRHAQASHVLVQLDETGHDYVLRVTDDGSAGPSAAALAGETAGKGLLGMRERAELLGGTFSAGPATLAPDSPAATLPAPTGVAPTGFAVIATIPRPECR